MRVVDMSGKRSDWIKKQALAVGFDRVGIARLREAAGGEAFLGWLERGDHAGMSYLTTRSEVRLDPRGIFEGAKSAICVALQYHCEESPEGSGDLWPRVARYARGRDYHNVMIKRLRKLARAIREEFPETQTRPYVDTGPVLERDLAAMAGLGATGKNTMLLHPEAGSYFLLGELFVSLDLETDHPLADLCGSCSLCLEACPTGALTEPYRLDSNRCISYWTIEHRGPIPRAMREQIGDWVFGCDVCQEVCPHNDDVLWRHDRAFELPDARAELDLAGLLDLDEEQYQEVFQGSPMKRSGHRGLKRNAAVVMGNRAEKRYVDPLGRALADRDPAVRSHAAWALGRIGGSQARRRLLNARRNETDEAVSRELSRALQQGDEPAQDGDSDSS